MHLFFKENFEANQVLDETDSRHCVKVLRFREGDEIWVTDGAGSLFQCQIASANPRKVILHVRSREFTARTGKRYVHLAIAPTKNIDRMTYLIEKAVEIGVQEISFVKTANSERKEIKTYRISRVAVAAMKQSLGSWLPQINEMENLDLFIEKCAADQKFLAHLSEDSLPLVNHSLKNKVCILIGPEGDFSQAELLEAKRGGFLQVSLGDSRLRTETAGLVAITLLNLLK